MYCFNFFTGQRKYWSLNKLRREGVKYAFEGSQQDRDNLESSALTAQDANSNPPAQIAQINPLKLAARGGGTVLECPYSDCSFTSKNLRGLRQHVQRSHSLNGRCPVCKKEFRNVLAHIAAKANDEEHAVFYALYRPGKRRTHEIFSSAKDLAVEVLEVDPDDLIPDCFGEYFDCDFPCSYESECLQLAKENEEADSDA